MATETQVKQLIGCKIIGVNGEEIGKVGRSISTTRRDNPSG